MPVLESRLERTLTTTATLDPITGRLIRTALDLLGRSERDLAQRPAVSVATLQKVERAPDGEMIGSPQNWRHRGVA